MELVPWHHALDLGPNRHPIRPDRQSCPTASVPSPEPIPSREPGALGPPRERIPGHVERA